MHGCSGRDRQNSPVREARSGDLGTNNTHTHETTPGKVGTREPQPERGQCRSPRRAPGCVGATKPAQRRCQRRTSSAPIDEASPSSVGRGDSRVGFQQVLLHVGVCVPGKCYPTQPLHIAPVCGGGQVRTMHRERTGVRVPRGLGDIFLLFPQSMTFHTMVNTLCHARVVGEGGRAAPS